MQTAQNFNLIACFYQDGYVIAAAAIGYHTNRDMFNSFQNLGCVTMLFGPEIANHTNNGLVYVDLDCTESV